MEKGEVGERKSKKKDEDKDGNKRWNRVITSSEYFFVKKKLLRQNPAGLVISTFKIALQASANSGEGGWMRVEGWCHGNGCWRCCQLVVAL